jgi:hypothetical protein
LPPSKKLDLRMTANVVWMYLRNHLVVRATASAPVIRKRRPT